MHITSLRLVILLASFAWFTTGGASAVSTSALQCTPQHGSCGESGDCCPGLTCQEGSCQPCVGEEGSCGGDVCCSGLECMGGNCTAGGCVEEFDTCESVFDCCEGLDCIGSLCRGCSPENEACSWDGDCCDDLVCLGDFWTGEFCGECIQLTQPGCAESDDCCDGGYCLDLGDEGWCV